MERLGIRESDILERFVRSAGPGGQNVNKVATCVYLKHLPSGIDFSLGPGGCILNAFPAESRAPKPPGD